MASCSRCQARSRSFSSGLNSRTPPAWPDVLPGRYSNGALSSGTLSPPDRPSAESPLIACVLAGVVPEGSPATAGAISLTNCFSAGIAAVGFCSSTALLLISTCRRCLEYMPSSIRPTTLASASKATSPALLLMRTVAGGSGCRSIPDGD